MDTNRSDGATVVQPHFRQREMVAPPVHRRGLGWAIALMVVLTLVAVALVVYFFWWRPHAAQLAAEQTGKGGGRDVPVVAATAKKGDLPIYLTGLGTVTPFNLVTVNSRVAGQITNVAFTEGQDVKQGDLLVEIDPRPFQVQLEQAEGQLGRDEALLANAKDDLARYQSAGVSVAQQQIDTAAATVRQDEAIVKSDQAGIDSAKLQLIYCRITAPFSGRIGLRKVDVGNIIQANDPNGIAVIAQLQPIAVEFGISQNDAPAVLRSKTGGIGMQVDAFDLGLKNQLAAGSISAVENQIDPTNGTLRIKASFANTDNALYPNQMVNPRLLVNTLKDVTLVPAAAVQHGPDGEFAYIVKKDQTVEVRNVTTGQTTDDITAINEGVQPGEVVVTDGVDKLQPGSKVAVREGGKRASATQPGATTEPTTRRSRG
ncbi:MAG TPA: MdtA/MuxA family multidrug efflux RND transporter periplasmic adaptor subunit [Tepidisphaeraceae bacterium]|jgi:multidrug efflux system membrane fusion protein|nr:MdtA/MuxA family multidrug efflux RND transporter periplasmic adaptor subunit [Tepidisphaeraceae bacterium]